MAEKESPFTKAMQEYKANVSSVNVREVSPSKLERNLFTRIVEKSNIFFEEGQYITFKYFSPRYLTYQVAPPTEQLVYPVSLGIAHLDGSAFKKRFG